MPKYRIEDALDVIFFGISPEDEVRAIAEKMRRHAKDGWIKFDDFEKIVDDPMFSSRLTGGMPHGSRQRAR